MSRPFPLPHTTSDRLGRGGPRPTPRDRTGGTPDAGATAVRYSLSVPSTSVSLSSRREHFASSFLRPLAEPRNRCREEGTGGKWVGAGPSPKGSATPTASRRRPIPVRRLVVVQAGGG